MEVALVFLEMARIDLQLRTVLDVVHREFNFACPAPGRRDGGGGSLVAERLRVVADLGLVKGHDDGG